MEAVEAVAVARDAGGRAYWVDCPTHGAQPPHYKRQIVDRGYGRRAVSFELHYLKRPNDPGLWGALGPVDTLRAACSRCALPGPVPDPASATGALKLAFPIPYVPLRVVALREDRAGGRPEECNGACLNGRRTCNCRCEGRCHGAGACACGGGA